MQVVCAAEGSTGFISAMRRRCVSGKYETCDIICKNAVCSITKDLSMVAKDQRRKFETSTSNNFQIICIAIVWTFFFFYFWTD